MKKILLFVVLVTMTAQYGFAQKSFPANKKEIMDSFIAGTLQPSYVPAAFFVHFDSKSKVGEGAINSHLKYLLNTNADVLKVQFEQRPPKFSNLDDQATWDAMKPIPVDFYRPTFEVIKGLYDVVGKDVYILPTIYSPYQVARQSVGDKYLAKAAVERPNDLKRLLGYYADALEWLVKSCKDIGIEGFYLTTQGGEKKYYSIPGWFDNFIKPYDLRVMNLAAEGTKINILHICDWEGVMDDLTRYVDYPGQIVNTPFNLDGTFFSLKDGLKLFGRPVLGGLDRHGKINSGTEEEVRDLVRKAIADGPKGKMMIGAECTVSEAPRANIHAAVDAAHHAKSKR